jgi:hypothetical protein
LVMMMCGGVMMRRSIQVPFVVIMTMIVMGGCFVVSGCCV